MPKQDYMYIQTYPESVRHSALQISRVSINRTFQKTERNYRNQKCYIVFVFNRGHRGKVVITSNESPSSKLKISLFT